MKLTGFLSIWILIGNKNRGKSNNTKFMYDDLKSSLCVAYHVETFRDNSEPISVFFFYFVKVTFSKVVSYCLYIKIVRLLYQVLNFRKKIGLKIILQLLSFLFILLLSLQIDRNRFFRPKPKV